MFDEAVMEGCGELFPEEGDVGLVVGVSQVRIATHARTHAHTHTFITPAAHLH